MTHSLDETFRRIPRRRLLVIACAAIVGALALYSSHGVHILGVLTYFLLLAVAIIHTLWEARADLPDQHRDQGLPPAGGDGA